MNSRLEFAAREVLPAPGAVLRAQGIEAGRDPGARTRDLCEKALAEFARLAAPRALIADLPLADFAALYRGEDLNDDPSPLASIGPRASRLALFALTLGDEVSGRIDALLAARDFALGSMLDAAASEAAERCADLVEERYRRDAELPAGEVVMRYSPGYCGWHVSGQRRLFAALDPSPIGLSLRESCLMEPLKSISGMLVAGPMEIHRFTASYLFCKTCKTQTCRSRQHALGFA